MYNVYECRARMYYDGISLVGADSAEEANEYIRKFKEYDFKNIGNSKGYGHIEEDDLIKGIKAEEKGIVNYGIVYTG